MRAMPDIDTPSGASVSFAPPEPWAGERGPKREGQVDRAAVPVGPGRPAIVAPTHGSGGLLGPVSDYPVQLDKVQAPPLRDETLARDRLLDWLQVKIHRRAILVLAEAGYGKTTLLADFTRRTRVRVAWYRLDRSDRDWLGFMAHLVAAFRIHEPEFAPATQSLIREASAANPSRDSVIDTFIRELARLPAEPVALVLDDFHLVDDSQDARAIVQEILARAPERLGIVLISRTTPSLPLARLRARGELAELRTSDLRFAPDETERLFRETYAMHLEPSVVAELSRRTEGWVASLQLVRAAIRDRNQTEIRAFVRSLSGAEGDLYDYLAEEVVGELAADLQQFLMRTSLLGVIEPQLGGVAAGITPARARRAIEEGELLGLFSRTGPSTRDHVRAHPLVRDFLQARLRRSIGNDAVLEIHRSVAAAAEATDWRIAGHHYVAAGDLDDARRVLAASIETILATGGYAAAEELVTALPSSDRPDPNVLVVLSRLAQQRGQASLGRDLAEAAFDEADSNPAAAMTLLSARVLVGDIDGASRVAATLAADGRAGKLALLGHAVGLTLETSLHGGVGVAIEALESANRASQERPGDHFLGVGLSNLGYLLKAQGDAISAGEAANEAVALLEASSAGAELVSARLLRAWSLAHGGDLIGARDEISGAASSARGDQSFEVAYEAAEVEALYGDPERALRRLLDADGVIASVSDAGEQALIPRIHAQISVGRIEGAERDAHLLRFGTLRSAVAFEARRYLAAALVKWATSDPSATVTAGLARDIARRQGALLWARFAHLVAAAGDRELLREAAREEADRDPATLSMAADVLAPSLDCVDAHTLGVISGEALRRPERWRAPLRKAVSTLVGGPQAIAAGLLDQVGAPEDVALLRRVARDARSSVPSSSGRNLARRLAAPVMIEDLGRLHLMVGTRSIVGSTIRRKVLALLCLLLTKSRFSAAREEVLEALWPDLEPSTAMNSLNQTVYFLRRVFEPSFSEDTTPGYIGQDGETIWLDGELVTSRSRMCRDLMREMAVPPPADAVLRLAEEYQGRFALDFVYEDWTAAYRDSLHASFLRLIETAMRADMTSGHYARGIRLAQLAVDAEPDAEELQIGLLRLYRLSGSMAAAAEQYEHYARSQRELGLDPEPFDRL